jgi:cytochrome c oxidase assembly protein subunit 15
MAVATGAPATTRRAVLVLLAVELVQGAIGFVQYFTDLPVVLVGLHMLGAALISATVTWAVLETLEPRVPLPAGGSPGPRADGRDRPARVPTPSA